MSIIFRDDMQVELIDHMGTDETVARAARVSTGSDQLEQGKISGLINYLVREGHTSTLEHCNITFRLEVPLFVRDQIVRHRTGNYNIQSARYSEMKPEFYIPPKERPLVNKGSGAHPDLQMAENEITRPYTVRVMKELYELAWATYEALIAPSRDGDEAVANEVARNVLPTALYTSMYMTMNLNNWFKFLDLRNGEKGHPQWEIVKVAEQVEIILQSLYPITFQAWQKHKKE